MTKKILVVDDEENLCILVTRFLESTGKYKVTAMSNPKEVVSCCLKDKPDLVILDIVMPEMDGRDIISILKENDKTKDIRIIVTSGGGEMTYSMDENKWNWEPNSDIARSRGDVVKERSHELAAAAYGVNAFLAKPFPPAFLLQVVEEVLGIKAEPEE